MKNVIKRDETENRLSYKFRIYPNKKQIRKMNSMMYESKKVYNELLELKNNTYKFIGQRYLFNYVLDEDIISDNLQGFRYVFGIYYYGNKKNLSNFDLINYLSGRCRTGKLYSQSYDSLCDVVTKSFDNFFGRIKKGVEKNKLGYPKFKSFLDFIIYRQSGFKIINKKLIYISKICSRKSRDTKKGLISISIHRNIIGKMKTLTIKKNKANQWHVCISCILPKQEILIENKPIRAIGIDNGLSENFMVLSNGEKIGYPRFLIKANKKLIKLQRDLSRKKIGSNNRKYAKLLLAKASLKVVNQRDNYLHHIADYLTNKYKIICCEGTDIKGLVEDNGKKNKSKLKIKLNELQKEYKNNPSEKIHKNIKRLEKKLNSFAKNINILDCSWGKFKLILTYKQKMKNGLLLNSTKTKGSSKRCSSCRNEKDIPLQERTYNCDVCGLILDRDVNSAINHLKDCYEIDILKIKDFVTKYSFNKLDENTEGQSEVNALLRICNSEFNEEGTINTERLTTNAMFGSPRL